VGVSAARNFSRKLRHVCSPLKCSTTYGDRMPLLGPADPLPIRPQRVLVAGTSGSGKTALAVRIGQLLGLPHVEIDSLFHGPNWTARASFERDVNDFSSGPRWTTEWQYPPVRAMLAERADLLVWLDLPRRVVISQVLRRTLRRRATREVLWNGNREPPLHTIFTDPEHIVRWAWSTHNHTTQRIADVRLQHPNLPVVQLRSHTEADHWLATAVAPGSADV
jgi:adenylate kinase family enzyme